MRVTPCLLLLLAVASSAASSARERSAPPRPSARERGGPTSITRAELLEHVTFLASDAMRGRDTGSEEIRRAEEHVAASFQEAGLQPLPGQDDFFVDFVLHREGLDPKETSFEITAPPPVQSLELGRHFRPFDFSAQGAVEAEVVFAGYGITASEHAWDDYRGLDVAGKIVLVLRHEPREDDPTSAFDGKQSSRHALFTSKLENALSHGAAGLVVVTDPLHHAEADDLRAAGSLRLPRPPDEKDADRSPPTANVIAPSTPAAERADRPSIVAVQVSREVAGRLVAGLGMTLSELQTAVDGGRRPQSFGGIRPLVRVSVRRTSDPVEVPARNVVGWLEGRDPVLKDEVVVIGGHHDHVGAFDGSGDTIFNGADDNASGTAAVLELAEAFGRAAKRPRRSIAFVTFSGEERGLLGSKELVERNALPMDRVVFMLNIDMIGRNPDKAIEVVGDGFTRGLRRLIEEESAGSGLALEFRGDSYFGASDHDAFYRRDVPFLFYFTGTHDDYHQVGDHVDKLDLPRMEKITRLAHATVGRIADAPSRPAFVHHVSWLGATVEVLEQGGKPAATVTSVEPGSRGDVAGLRERDVLVGVNEPLADPRSVGAAFRAVDPGTKATLTIDRAGSPVTVAVERARPGVLGIFPASVDADVRKKLGLLDDQGLTIRQLVADGPSQKAGLRVGDVLVQLAGSPVSQRTLSQRLAQLGAGEEVEAVVLRDGERVAVKLTLGERQERPERP